MKTDLKKMSDMDLLTLHFLSGTEMMNRNMVGAELWKTPGGVVAAGTPDAKEELLRIYEDEASGFSALLDKLALRAAQGGKGQEVQVAHPFADARPPKLACPLSVMNERQLANYCVQLLNHQRMINGEKRWFANILDHSRIFFWQM